MKGEAFEYLITYGWAGTIVLMVFVSLWVMGVFDHPNYMEEWTEEWECVEWENTTNYFVEIIGEPVPSFIKCDLEFVICFKSHLEKDRNDEGLKKYYNITPDMIKNKTITKCTKQQLVRRQS